MQKMSEEIAIYCLKADSESYSEVCEECSIYGNVGCDHCYNDAINMAIKALEKQIPNKPYKDRENGVYYKEHCPCCGRSLFPNDHHCVCGQAIDWSDN